MTALATMIEQLESRDATQRQRAAESLLSDPAQGKLCAARLAQAAGDRDEVVRELIHGVLEEMGPPSLDQLAPLLEVAETPSPDAAYWAVTLIGRLGRSAGPAVATLARLLATHEEAAVRQRAAWALGAIGAAAEPARAELEAAAASSDPRTARLAKSALLQLAPSSAN